MNCPSCQKLILLPAESPLHRKDETTPPFQKGTLYESDEVASAICASVDPYRRDLENKTGLLNDAVEMVKVRNERIRDIETLMLKTQKELWEIEFALDEQEQPETEDAPEPEGESDPGSSERIRELEDKKDKLKAKLTTMVAHSENLENKLNDLREMVKEEGPTLQMIEQVSAAITRHLEKEEAENRDLDVATEYLGQASKELLNLHRQVAEKENLRQQMEELVASSTEDMSLAVEERNQWRKKATALEKEYLQLQSKFENVSLQASEAEKLHTELSEDRDHAARLRSELEENLELLRTRIEQERSIHQKTLEERESKLKADAQKRISVLEKKLKSANADLDAAEEKLEISLKTQHQLADQNMQGEQQRRQMKAELETLREQLSENEES